MAAAGSGRPARVSCALVIVDGLSPLSAPFANERVAEYPHPTPSRAKGAVALAGGAAVNWTHQLVGETLDTTVPPAGSDAKLGYCRRAWAKGMAVGLGNRMDPAADNPETVAGLVTA